MNNNIQSSDELNSLSEKEFMKLWDNNKMGCYWFVMNKLVCNNVADAEDILQTTFEKAWKNKHLFKKWTNFWGWICMIAKNNFINDYRKTQKYWWVTVDLDYIDPACLSINIHSYENIIELSIEALSDDFKEVLKLRSQDYKYEEIAEELKIPLWTVRSRIFRGKEMLLDNLKKYDPDLLQSFSITS